MSRTRHAGVSTLRRYSHGLGFFEDVADFSGGWEDWGDPGAEFGDIYADYSSADLIDFGGDDVLSFDVDSFMPDPYDYSALPVEDYTPATIDAEPYDYSFDGQDVEPGEGVPDYDVPGFSDPSGSMRLPSIPSLPASLPAKAPVSTGGPGGLLSTVFGEAVQRDVRRVQTGTQNPGTMYLPGVRPGMVNLPGQPGATAYRPATPTAAKVADFVKKNALPLALAGGALLFLTMKPTARSSRRAR